MLRQPNLARRRVLAAVDGLPVRLKARARSSSSPLADAFALRSPARYSLPMASCSRSTAASVMCSCARASQSSPCRAAAAAAARFGFWSPAAVPGGAFSAASARGLTCAHSAASQQTQ